MMHIRFEELWRAPSGGPYMIIVTTNAVTNGCGRLVMGAGSAFQAKELYPALPSLAQKKIRETYPAFKLQGWNEDYGFLPVIEPPHGVGIFQTKRHWRETARMETIQKSAQMLRDYALAHPEIHFRLPFPGIGKGRWGSGEQPDENEIRRILTCLPDNVTVVQWRS